MKIFFTSTLHGNWGGSEWLWTDAALHLARGGHPVGYYLPWRKNHAQFQSLRSAGAREYCGIEPTRWYTRLARRFRPRLTAFERALRDFQPDLVVLSQARQDQGSDWHAVMAQLTLPYVILNQQVVEALYLDDNLADALLGLFSHARFIYTVADRNLRVIEQQLGCPLANASVVRNPVRVPRDVNTDWPPGEHLELALVGRLDPDQKGHDALLEVLARRRWRDRSIRLSFYGSGSAQRRLQRTVGQLSLQNVGFKGHLNDVAAIWQRNHVVAQPSREEGLPIAMVEGMLMGRPVFATAVAGIPEVVTDGVHGFLAPACMPDLLDEALERLWNARGELPAMGLAARQRALALFPEDAGAEFAERLLNLNR